MNSFRKQTGFSLIELLVVVGIISLFSSIIFASMKTAKESSHDAERLQFMVQMQRALELYNDENSQYPPRDDAHTNGLVGGCGNANWDSLRNDLSPYYQLPCDPLGPNNTFFYRYDADSSDNYQSYGLLFRFEASGNFPKVAQDGGFDTYADTVNGRYYEVGQQPSYCETQYDGASANWTGGGAANICAGGN